jgi:lipopolysaccharide transport system permease protein
MAVEFSQKQIAQSAQRRVKKIHPASFSPFDVFAHLGELARYRDLLWTLSVHRVRVRYKQSLLGISWAILQPLSLMLIYTAIFSVVAKIPSDGLPYALFAFAALLPWTAFSTALTNATNGLVSHQQLVTKVYFPREILPLTYVFASIFDLLIGAIVLAGMMIFYHVALTPNLLFVVPIVLLLVAFATAASLILSAAQVHFRDIGVAMPLFLQLWMFASPVVYPFSSVPQRFKAIVMLNPMVGIIENFRRVVIQGQAPEFATLGVAAAVSLLALPAAYMFFKRFESTVADVI